MKFDENKNYYDILFLKKDCLKTNIRKAYRSLSKKYHPDKNKGKEDKFILISEAYDVLYNAESRKEYDNFLESLNISTDFADSRKLDIYIEKKFDFNDYLKNDYTIKYIRRVVCDECSGTGGLKKCTDCSGTGKSRITFSNQGRCKTCKGKKYIKSDYLCLNNCNQGLINKTQFFDIKLQDFELDKVNERTYTKGGNYHKYERRYGKFTFKFYIESDNSYYIKNNKLYKNVDVHYKDAIEGNDIVIEHSNKKYNIKLPKKTRDKDILSIGKNKLYLKVNIIIDYNLI